MPNNFAYPGFDEPHQVLAELPDDVSGVMLRLVRADAPGLSRGNVETLPRRAGDHFPYFEIYYAERVSITSILFSGGDWRWRFCAGDGAPIAASMGYISEGACMAAVTALRSGAASAEVRNS